MTFYDANKTFFSAPEYEADAFTTTDLEHMSDVEFYQIIRHLWNNPPTQGKKSTQAGHYTLADRVDYMNQVLAEADRLIDKHGNSGPGRIAQGYPHLTIAPRAEGGLTLTLQPRDVVEAEQAS